jgi:glutathione S-transferase
MSLICSLLVLALVHGATAMALQTQTSTPSGLKLFGSQGSRSPLVSWYLHELNLPFEMINPRNPLSKDVNPHPFGQVPALEDNGLGVFESGAILTYLADKYGSLDTPEKRAAVGMWCMWANSSLDPICFVENERGQVLGTKANKENAKLRRLEAILGEGGVGVGGSKTEGSGGAVGDEGAGLGGYLLGQFSAADVAVASYLLYLPQFFGRGGFAADLYPNTAAYMLRCASREGYRRAYPGEVEGVLSVCRSYVGV